MSRDVRVSGAQRPRPGACRFRLVACRHQSLGVALVNAGDSDQGQAHRHGSHHALAVVLGLE